MVDEGNGKFNLMLLCWGEGHASAVHDHSDAHCFMKMLDGSLNEIRYAWPDESTGTCPATEGDIEAHELQTIGSSLLEVNGVCYINGTSKKKEVEFVICFDQICPISCCFWSKRQTLKCRRVVKNC